MSKQMTWEEIYDENKRKVEAYEWALKEIANGHLHEPVSELIAKQALLEVNDVK